MAKNCSVCGKKIAFIIEDFPLSNEMEDVRICPSCNDHISRLNRFEGTPNEATSESYDQIKSSLDTAGCTEAVDNYLREVLEHVDRLNEKRIKEAQEKIEIENEIQREQEQKDEKYQYLIENMLMTTGSQLEGYKISEYHDIIFSEVIFKASFMSTMDAGFEDLGNSFSFKSKEMTGTTRLVEQAKLFGKDKLCAEAARLGANAIIGIDVETSYTGSTLSGMLTKVSFSGTAVTVDQLNK